jgi:hypothetical protein
MAKKKKKSEPPLDAPAAPKPAGPIGTSLRDLLQGVEPAKPQPKKAEPAKEPARVVVRPSIPSAPA